MSTGFEPDASNERLPARSRLTRWIGLLVSAAALAGVVVWASGQEAPEFPSGVAPILTLLGAVAIYGLATVLRGERWWWLLRDAEVDASRREAIELTAVGYMGNNVLPARAGDVMKVVCLRPGVHRRRAVIGTLVAERVLDVIFLLSLFMVLGYAILQGIETPKLDVLVVGAGAGAALLAVVAACLWAFRGQPRVARAIEFLAPLLRPTLRLRGSHLGLMVAQTVGIWALEITTYFVIGQALEIDMSFTDAAYIIAVAGVFLLIPSGPGYVGTLDAALLFGLDAIGTTGSQAVTYLLTARLVVFVPVTVAGLILFVWRYR